MRLTGTGCGVSERTVWRWIGPDAPERDGRARQGYRLSETDRAAYDYFRGSATAVHRARRAAVEGSAPPGGAPLPDFLAQGWQDARPVGERTLRRAFADQLIPAERALVREGENARRAAQVYLSRPPSARNQVWEADHKQLPILVMPPRGAPVRPWMTTIVDDATRALVGCSIALSPHAGTVVRLFGAGAEAHQPARPAALRRTAPHLADTVKAAVPWTSPPGTTHGRAPTWTEHRFLSLHPLDGDRW